MMPSPTTPSYSSNAFTTLALNTFFTGLITSSFSTTFRFNGSLIVFTEER